MYGNYNLFFDIIRYEDLRRQCFYPSILSIICIATKAFLQWIRQGECRTSRRTNGPWRLASSKTAASSTCLIAIGTERVSDIYQWNHCEWHHMWFLENPLIGGYRYNPKHHLWSAYIDEVFVDWEQVTRSPERLNETSAGFFFVQLDSVETRCWTCGTARCSSDGASHAAFSAEKRPPPHTILILFEDKYMRSETMLCYMIPLRIEYAHAHESQTLKTQQGLYKT